MGGYNCVVGDVPVISRRTKLKTIYVISTYKRPVPLKHFLYTGNSKQTSDQLFEIVGDNKRFNTRGLVDYSLVVCM